MVRMLQRKVIEHDDSVLVTSFRQISHCKNGVLLKLKHCELTEYSIGPVALHKYDVEGYRRALNRGKHGLGFLRLFYNCGFRNDHQKVTKR
jgi:hypothetical protein